MQGIGASPGIARGRVYIKKDHIKVAKQTIQDLDEAIVKYEKAVARSREQLKELIEKNRASIGDEEAKIFEAHLLLLDDPELNSETANMIENEKVNPEWAVQQVGEKYSALLENLEDVYLRERASDVRDVTMRIIRNMMGLEGEDYRDLTEPSIIVASDLTPSDTASIPREIVVGFITEKGSETAHVAIMARTLGIPAIVGCGKILDKVNNNDTVIIDGETGTFHINPGSSELKVFDAKKIKCDADKAAAEKYRGRKTVTADRKEYEILCNIGSPGDLDQVIKNDGQGVGLYRTEFLYMDRQALPGEDEQFEAYKYVAEGIKGKQVVIRTLDIGGDKNIPYLDFPVEANPFLGLRGIRFCLQAEDLFLTQLKAILRASVFGNIKLMFPMISSLDELLRAKKLLSRAMDDLNKKGVKYNPDVKVGIMVEIPSAALISDHLACHADFFSIGMNDLIQYTVAADRMNEKVASYYTPYHPALLRLLKMIIDNGHNAGIKVAMCGEAARDPLLIPLLVGMGLDEFSVSPTSILPVRKQINELSFSSMKDHIKSVIDLRDTESVTDYLKINFKP